MINLTESQKTHSKPFKIPFKLFPYQVIGKDWLKTKKFCLLADEMGLGKSIQAIKASDEINAERILIICPAIARINWHNEFEKFSLKLRKFTVVQKRLDSWPLNSSVICSYETACSVKKTGHFDVLIIDEGHYLKSRTARRTKAILGSKGLIHKASRVWVLSGTPAPNNASELWPLLKVFNVTNLTYTQFIERYCTVFKGPYGLQITGTKKSTVRDLRENLLGPIMLRRLKADVMKELPPIIYKEYFIPPSPVDCEILPSFVPYITPTNRLHVLYEKIETEKKLAQSIFDNFGSFKSGRGVRALEAMAQSVSTLRRYTGCQKVKNIVDIVDKELKNKAYDKIVIFAIHRDVIEGIRDGLKHHGAVALYGGNTPEKKQRNLDRFKNRNSCKVIVCNIQTAGTAINLTNAHNIIFVEYSWVSGDNAQAVMRCHRIGQDKPVLVRFYALNDSIDAKISRALKKKTAELTEIFD